MDQMLFHISTGSNFLTITANAQLIIAKRCKRDYIKAKNSAKTETKIKHQHTDQGKLFINHISNKERASKIYIEIMKFNRETVNS